MNNEVEFKGQARLSPKGTGEPRFLLACSPHACPVSCSGAWLLAFCGSPIAGCFVVFEFLVRSNRASIPAANVTCTV